MKQKSTRKKQEEKYAPVTVVVSAAEIVDLEKNTYNLLPTREKLAKILTRAT